jgi:hypothetical protein
MVEGWEAKRVPKLATKNEDMRVTVKSPFLRIAKRFLVREKKCIKVLFSIIFLGINFTPTITFLCG